MQDEKGAAAMDFVVENTSSSRFTVEKWTCLSLK